MTSSPTSPLADAPMLSYLPDPGSLDNVFISISGLIGAGKTTLAIALSKELGLPVWHEPVADNEYLADFYADMRKYAFPIQIYLLNRRFQQHQQIIWSGRGGVQDRTIYEDAIFARMLTESGLMEERDYRTYLSLFSHMSNFMKKPNVIVYLDLSPEESLERIRARKRDCESGISLEYLTGLHRCYERFITEISTVIPVIKVNYSQFRTPEEMATVIRHEFSKIHNIREVTWDKNSQPVFHDDVAVKTLISKVSSASSSDAGGSDTEEGAAADAERAPVATPVSE